MFLMYDDTDLSQIPANPHAVGCYRNGNFANEQEARVRFPHAHILPISVHGLVACDCYDIETGDYSPDQAAALVRFAAAHGIWRPCLYANASTWPAVQADLDRNKIPRGAYRKWRADFDGISVLDADDDAKQFTDKALGRNLDESICRDTFFPAPPAPRPTRFVAEIAFDSVHRSWAIAPLPFGTRPLG